MLRGAPYGFDAIGGEYDPVGFGAAFFDGCDWWGLWVRMVIERFGCESDCGIIIIIFFFLRNRLWYY